MPEEIVMPRLSDTMEQGTIGHWRKRVGDTVHKGDVILEVETDKANMDLQAYSDGIIGQIIIDDGGTADIGSIVGYMNKIGEALQPSAIQVTPPVTAALKSPTPVDNVKASVTAAPTIAAPVIANGYESNSRIKVTPLARNMARDRGIDLHALDGHGSGPSGRIVKLDVEKYSASESPSTSVAVIENAQADVTYREPNRIQQVMARRLQESKSTVPHFYVTNEVDMLAAVVLRKNLVSAFGDEGKVSINDMIVRACALSLRAMPDVNTSWQQNRFVIYSHVNIGIAVGLDEGLVVPVVRDADQKSLRELSREIKSLVDKARHNKLSPRDMESGTFTISNLGMYDVEEFQAIINPPESAILAVGAMMDKPVVLDGAVVVRPRMKLTLSVDHRVIPGVPAAQFLQSVKRLLQEPLHLGF